MGFAPTLKHQLLDLLVDGPASFASLYSAANRLLNSKYFTVEELWETLVAMEAFGWISLWLMLPAGTWAKPDSIDRETARRRYQNWLPNATYEEMSVDKVGLWFELQSLGRNEWTKWSEIVDASQKWMLDQNSETSTIMIHATNADHAKQVLTQWLEQHPDIELVCGTQIVESSAGFCLRNGTFVENGISMRVIYRETTKTDHQ